MCVLVCACVCVRERKREIVFGLRKMPGPAASIALHALLFPSLAQVSEIGFVFVYACALVVALSSPPPAPSFLFLLPFLVCASVCVSNIWLVVFAFAWLRCKRKTLRLKLLLNPSSRRWRRFVSSFVVVVFFLPGEKEAKGKGMVSSHGLLLLVVSFSVVLLFLRPSRATRA